MMNFNESGMMKFRSFQGTTQAFAWSD